MRSQDLRVDNYVLVNNHPMRVAAVHKRKAAFHFRFDQLGWYRIDVLAPVKLTEELLDKNFCKDESCKDTKQWVLGTCWQIRPNPKYGFILVTLEMDEFGSGGYVPCIPCTYVHELQNMLADLRIDKRVVLYKGDKKVD